MDVLAQIEAIGHEVQVAFGLGLGRKALAPVPLVVQLLGEPILIDVRRRIDARAGITVPVPSAANVVAGFHGLHLESLLTQAIELVHAGDSRADDEGIELDGGPRGVHGRLLSLGVDSDSRAAQLVGTDRTVTTSTDITCPVISQTCDRAPAAWAGSQNGSVSVAKK